MRYYVRIICFVLHYIILELDDVFLYGKESGRSALHQLFMLRGRARWATVVLLNVRVDV